MKRRDFLLGSMTFPAAAALGREQAPPGRVRGAFLKLSCNLYSFNEPLRSGAMKLEEVFDYCAELGLAAVDPTGYYFPGYPAVPDDGYVNFIKRRAFLNGLDISGTGVRNDFTEADGAKRKSEIQLVKSWIEVAARLGAPVLRVFSGRAPAPGQPREEVTRRVVDACRECADYAAKYGVIDAVQNHVDFIETSDHVLELLEKVNSEWFGLHLDIGSFRKRDAYDEIARVLPHAVNWQLKEEIYRGDKPEKTDLARLFGIIRAGGFRGYLPLETLGAGDPKVKVARFLEEVKKVI
jgi:sugar phosphate isomerase/epimerase